MGSSLSTCQLVYWQQVFNLRNFCYLLFYSLCRTSLLTGCRQSVGVECVAVVGRHFGYGVDERQHTLCPQQAVEVVLVVLGVGGVEAADVYPC